MNLRALVTLFAVVNTKSTKATGFLGDALGGNVFTQKHDCFAGVRALACDLRTRGIRRGPIASPAGQRKPRQVDVDHLNAHAHEVEGIGIQHPVLDQAVDQRVQPKSGGAGRHAPA